jgi:hypothetical protein
VNISIVAKCLLDNFFHPFPSRMASTSTSHESPKREATRNIITLEIPVDTRLEVIAPVLCPIYTDIHPRMRKLLTRLANLFRSSREATTIDSPPQSRNLILEYPGKMETSDNDKTDIESGSEVSISCQPSRNALKMLSTVRSPCDRVDSPNEIHDTSSQPPDGTSAPSSSYGDKKSSGWKYEKGETSYREYGDEKSSSWEDEKGETSYREDGETKVLG